MLRAVLLEDEILAANRLVQLLEARTQVPLQVVAQLASVQDAVAYFRTEPAPDLAFFDIQLGDGLSFEVFDQVEVSCPIIFTTAYDAYALRAFKANSIDYLLKPLDREELETALKKFNRLIREPAGSGSPGPDASLQLLRQILQELKNPAAPTYKNRFVLKVGEHLRAIPV